MQRGPNAGGRSALREHESNNVKMLLGQYKWSESCHMCEATTSFLFFLCFAWSVRRIAERAVGTW